jgi:hypothetical protein
VNQVTAVQALSEQPALSEEDAALLVAAHMDLVAAQASGVRVLGSSAGRELVAAAHTRLATSGAFVLVTLPLGDGELQVPLPITGPGFVSSPASSRNEVAA